MRCCSIRLTSWDKQLGLALLAETYNKEAASLHHKVETQHMKELRLAYERFSKIAPRRSPLGIRKYYYWPMRQGDVHFLLVEWMNARKRLLAEGGSDVGLPELLGRLQDNRVRNFPDLDEEYFR